MKTIITNPTNKKNPPPFTMTGLRLCLQEYHSAFPVLIGDENRIILYSMQI